MEPLSISLQTAAVATGLMGVVAILAARARFSMSRGCRRALDVLFLLPLLFSPLVLAGPLVYFAGLIPQPFHLPLGAALVAADCIGTLPIFYLCALMGFRPVQQEWIDAARLQGLGQCGIFWRVFFPTAWPWLAAGLALGFFRCGLLSLLTGFSPIFR